MKIRLTQCHNREAWHEALACLPHTHVLQSWEWGDFKGRWGWQAERLVWRTEGEPVAAAQILQRPIPGTPWRFLYVSKGPVLNYADIPLVRQVLRDLEEHARQVGGLFIKIDPDVPHAYGPPPENPAPDPIGQAWLNLLTERGWRFSPEQIQFRNTMLLDLRPMVAELLQGMKNKWRYNIRLAERKGVVIRSGTLQDIDLFYRVYAETAARDDFLIRSAAYYRDGWVLFMEAKQAEMLLAEVEGEVVAGLMLFFYGQTAWYLYGASTGQQRHLMPNYLLQWQAICRAKERGCIGYDMWGAPDTFVETDRMWGVYRFKQGFGGQVRQGLGAFDYPVKPILYWAFTAALSRLRTWLRWLR